MKKTEFLYLSQEDVLALNLSIRQIVDAVERVLRSHGQRRVQMPPKPGIFPRKESYSYFHAMPAFIEDLDICGIKWLGRASDNPKRYGLPQFSGFQILNDPETALPLCVMDCRWITAARTAAVSVVTARLCASKKPEALAILGTGLQGRFHALMLASEFPSIRTIYVYNRSEKGCLRFLDDVAPRVSAKLIPSDAEEAVKSSDIVVTAGIMQPLIRLNWISPGALGLGLDLARAWYPEVVSGIDLIITDDIGQFWHRYETEPEAYNGKPKVHAELSSVLLGRDSGRRSERDRVLALNLGMAVCDLVLGDLVYCEARRRKIGTVLPLMEREDLLPELSRGVALPE